MTNITYVDDKCIECSVTWWLHVRKVTWRTTPNMLKFSLLSYRLHFNVLVLKRHWIRGNFILLKTQMKIYISECYSLCSHYDQANRVIRIKLPNPQRNSLWPTTNCYVQKQRGARRHAKRTMISLKSWQRVGTLLRTCSLIWCSMAICPFYNIHL